MAEPTVEIPFKRLRELTDLPKLADGYGYFLEFFDELNLTNAIIYWRDDPKTVTVPAKFKDASLFVALMDVDGVDDKDEFGNKWRYYQRILRLPNHLAMELKLRRC